MKVLDRKVYFLIIQLLCTGMFAQDRKISDVQDLMRDRNYPGAIRMLESFESKEMYPKRTPTLLGLCYYELRRYEDAATWFGEAKKRSASFTDTEKNDYIRTLYSLGRIDQLNALVSGEFNSLNQEGKDLVEAIQSRHVFLADSGAYEVRSIEVNRDHIIGPVFYGQQLLFASPKSTRNKALTYESLDLFVADFKDDVISNIRPFDKALNGPYNDGPIDFYAGQTKAVLSRNMEAKGVVGLGLFFAERSTSGDWQVTGAFPHNNSEYSITHPSISEDGKILIFSSTRSNGYGKSDLYVSYLEGDQWSVPVNLGPGVNTSQNEMFPVVVGRKLYFASDGHAGLGALDLFQVDLVEVYEKRGKPLNLGYPINSRFDDFSVLIRPGSVRGYFVSNRNGRDQLFDFHIKRRKLDIKTEPSDALTLSGFQVTNKDRPVSGTLRNGSFSIQLIADNSYELMADAPGYNPTPVKIPDGHWLIAETVVRLLPEEKNAVGTLVQIKQLGDDSFLLVTEDESWTLTGNEDSLSQYMSEDPDKALAHLQRLNPIVADAIEKVVIQEIAQGAEPEDRPIGPLFVPSPQIQTVVLDDLLDIEWSSGPMNYFGATSAATTIDRPTSTQGSGAFFRRIQLDARRNQLSDQWTKRRQEEEEIKEGFPWMYIFLPVGLLALLLFYLFWWRKRNSAERSGSHA